MSEIDTMHGKIQSISAGMEKKYTLTSDCRMIFMVQDPYPIRAQIRQDMN